MIDFKKELNETQYEAVTSEAHYLRIIAGAGSGKTRVLTYRIAYLIGVKHVDPSRIVAITFTNKVAGEMKRRVLSLVDVDEKEMHISTFHSLAVRILRSNIHRLNFPSSFTILDEEDQMKIFSDIGKRLGYSKKDPILKKAITYISNEKCKGHYPEDIDILEDIPNQKTYLQIYNLYEQRKNEIYAYDFDDLLLKAIELLTSFPDVRNRYLRSIDHILVDEFQDTNDVQFKFMSLLMDSHTSLYVVGDPDQTIYTWRGANQKIILDVGKIFAPLETIILARNYRSTQKILKAANSLIACNKERVKKDLYTENDDGERVHLIVQDSPIEEARSVAIKIKELKDSGRYDYKDIAIIYRSNYLTLDFEHALMSLRIPYRVYGGLRFYQRKEIKDVLAYFRLLANPKDDIALLRIINVPKRGIGDKMIALLQDEAKNLNLSLYEYIASSSFAGSFLRPQSLLALKAMVGILETAKGMLQNNEKPYFEVMQKTIMELGYLDFLAQDEDEEDRIANVMTLFEDAKNFATNEPNATFDEYLQNVALLSAQDDINDGDNVSLLTVHTAKGLEYPVVFLVRLSEGIFPNQKTLMEGFKNLEEERRLCYVAFTRAKDLLYITYNNGFSAVLGSRLAPSRFLREAKLTNNPDVSQFKKNLKPLQEKIEEEYSPIQIKKDNGINDWQVGDICMHTRLGRGVVRKVNPDNLIEVEFDEHGLKMLIGNHPTLSRVEEKGHQA